MSDTGDKTIVIHSTSRWLPQTATWLYDEVRFLPPSIESHIVCEASLNLDQFPHENIHSLADSPVWQNVWDRGVRKLGLRHHLDFLVRHARRTGARVLHSHFGDIGWQDSGAARSAGLKHVVTFYGLDVNYIPRTNRKWAARYRELFERVDRVLCEGPHMAQCIVGLGCPEGKIRVHHLGVDVDAIPFRPAVWAPGEPLRALIAASFTEKKGIPYALDALGRLQHDVPLEITIIGDAHEAPRSLAEKERILSAIEEHNLGHRTHLLGYTPHAVVHEEAQRHHVFVQPSVTSSDGDTEGGAPVSIIEMCAAGVPVVCTTHCDIPGVVLNGVTGLLAPERDADGLLEHLRWLVKHTDKWPAMLAAGRKHIEAEFNARVQGERLAAIYRELAGE